MIPANQNETLWWINTKYFHSILKEWLIHQFARIGDWEAFSHSVFLILILLFWMGSRTFIQLLFEMFWSWYRFVFVWKMQSNLILSNLQTYYFKKSILVQQKFSWHIRNYKHTSGHKHNNFIGSEQIFPRKIMIWRRYFENWKPFVLLSRIVNMSPIKVIQRAWESPDFLQHLKYP